MVFSIGIKNITGMDNALELFREGTRGQANHNQAAKKYAV
jgi:hypothetical protein